MEGEHFWYMAKDGGLNAYDFHRCQKIAMKRADPQFPQNTFILESLRALKTVYPEVSHPR